MVKTTSSRRSTYEREKKEFQLDNLHKKCWKCNKGNYTKIDKDGAVLKCDECGATAGLSPYKRWINGVQSEQRFLINRSKEMIKELTRQKKEQANRIKKEIAEERENIKRYKQKARTVR